MLWPRGCLAFLAWLGFLAWLASMNWNTLAWLPHLAWPGFHLLLLFLVNHAARQVGEARKLACFGLVLALAWLYGLLRLLGTTVCGALDRCILFDFHFGNPLHFQKKMWFLFFGA